MYIEKFTAYLHNTVVKTASSRFTFVLLVLNIAVSCFIKVALCVFPLWSINGFQYIQCRRLTMERSLPVWRRHRRSVKKSGRNEIFSSQGQEKISEFCWHGGQGNFEFCTISGKSQGNLYHFGHKTSFVRFCRNMENHKKMLIIVILYTIPWSIINKWGSVNKYC